MKPGIVMIPGFLIPKKYIVTKYQDIYLTQI
jgi:hypothetical protein